MKRNILGNISKVIGILIAVFLLLSVANLGVLAVGDTTGAVDVADYVCDFEGGSYGKVSDRTNTGTIGTDENGNNYLRFEMPTSSDSYRFEVYNAEKGTLKLKDGYFYCITMRYKVENIANVTDTDLGTGINAVRHDKVSGKQIKIKSMTGANYKPGETTGWETKSIVFKAVISTDKNADILAINISSPSCGTVIPDDDNLVSVILVDDIKVYERAGTTGAIEFNSNGGEYCAPVLATAGQGITIPTPVRKYYDFKGWFTDTQLTKSFIGATMPTGLVTRLYAKWAVADASIAVSFNSTGGLPVATLAGEAGLELSLPKTERYGYNFGGWYNADYTKKVTLTAFPSEDMTLYAKWEPISMFAGFENADKYSKPNDNSFTKRCVLSKNDKASGEYSLFYDYSTGTGSAYQAWAGVQLLDEYNEKYNAKKGQSYKITFKYKVIEVEKPGDIGVVLSEKEGCWSGERVALNDNREFNDTWVTYDKQDVGKGWQEGSVVFTPRYGGAASGYVAIGISGIARLYVDDIVIAPYDERFPSNNKCMISFESNFDLHINSIFGDYGQTIELPVPQREGYRFIGWFTDANCKTVFRKTNFEYRYTKLYADWFIPTDTEEELGSDVVPDDENDGSKGIDLKLIIIIAVAVIAVAVVVVALLVVIKNKKKPAGCKSDGKEKDDDK